MAAVAVLEPWGRIQAHRSGSVWWLSRRVCTGTMVEGRIRVSGANDLVTEADPSSGGADDVQLPLATMLSLVRAEARGNGGLRRVIAFGATAEGERNLCRAFEQLRSGRLRPWLHEGTTEERDRDLRHGCKTEQQGSEVFDLFMTLSFRCSLKVRGDGSLRSSVVVGVSDP
ncbi:hypothetical protein SESBI_42863 [Sesbania bispinosa]|nr:hypothetical protein SESBI_42863 [Sesbania bispinosa]